MENLRKTYNEISRTQIIEFILVVILAVNIFGLWFYENNMAEAVIIVCLLALLAPIVFKPFAVLWMLFSEKISIVGSTIILGSIFFVVVTPVGLFRRLLGKDSLKIEQFKKSRKSVFVDRNHLYSSDEMTKIF